MADIPLGYYVHHHGMGHMQRALQICAYIKRPVILFSSRLPTGTLPKNVQFVELPSDVVDGFVQPQDSAFHYTPWSEKIFIRYDVISQSIRKNNIKDMYVDVSTEVALFAKLLGLNVGHAIMHGVRTDTAHSRCYDSVDFLLSHNSQKFDTPENRNTDTPIKYSGGISRFKKHEVSTKVQHNNALVVCSPAAEIDYHEHIITAAKALPNITFNVIGLEGVTQESVSFHGNVTDPRLLFESADFIIGAGGNNTIMEASSYAKPLICIPENRPYNEQHEAAKALERLSAGIYLDEWPNSAEWLGIIKSLDTIDLEAFANLTDEDAAHTAAVIIEQSFQR